MCICICVCANYEDLKMKNEKTKDMNKQQNFLVRYGLHGFVHFVSERGRETFLIKDLQGSKMIAHAKCLIQSTFGESAQIRVM